MSELYASLAELLEVDEVRPADVLADFELWDSLTKLSLVATLGTKFGVNITADELNGIGTAGALNDFVESKRKA